MKNKKISLSDIAERLGVSKTLVSMVLNGKADENGISKATQEKVLKLAKELNYKPNQFARGLRLGNSNTIGLIVSDISNPFYAKLARYVEDYCSQEQYNLIICNSDENSEKEKKIIQTLIEKQVDGLIISSTIENTEHLRMLTNEDISYILIDRIYPSYPTHHVIIDNYTGARIATEHLLQNGHKRIACFTVEPAHINSQIDRFLGYKDAIEASPIDFNEFYHKSINRENMYQSIYIILRDWLDNKIMPTAVFSANNQVTLTLLEVCRELNIHIPTKLSVVSFDDIDAFRFSNPQLTAIVQPIKTIAKYAVENLIKVIKFKKINNEPPQLFQVKLETNIVIRESVAKLV